MVAPAGRCVQVPLQGAVLVLLLEEEKNKQSYKNNSIIL